MNLPATLFPAYWRIAALLLVLVVFWRLARAVKWKTLFNTTRLHVALGFAVALTLLWSLKAGVLPGLSLHLLGAMAATLALGPALALISMGLALTGITLNGALEWQDWPINYIFMVLVPVLFASIFKKAVEKTLPAHFFIFIFVLAFMGAGVTIFLQGSVVSLCMAMSGVYSADFLLGNYLPFFLLIGFSEAWISGALITLLVVYRPDWVSGFDDRRYLFDK